MVIRGTALFLADAVDILQCVGRINTVGQRRKRRFHRKRQKTAQIVQNQQLIRADAQVGDQRTVGGR